MTSSKPVATAILAVYNAESTISPCLSSLLTQSVPIEIIVVDDGSSDDTLAIIHSDVSIDRNAVILKQNHGGPALARNLGAIHATTPILLFVDADMVFDKDYVQDLIAPIQKGEVIGTYTTEERVANWDNVWARCSNIQEGWEEKKRFKPNPPKYGTDFRAILKSEFERVGGFDNVGYTDTWSLFHKLQLRPLATIAICYHKNPDTLAAVFRQARWSAKRPYKYGLIGTFYALLRATFPVSLIVGLVKSFQEPRFIIFKLVYDLGRFIGILEMIATGKLAK
jgi:glycosyltransferase involved in cell wall biosynthesis